VGRLLDFYGVVRSIAIKPSTHQNFAFVGILEPPRCPVERSRSSASSSSRGANRLSNFCKANCGFGKRQLICRKASDEASLSARQYLEPLRRRSPAIVSPTSKLGSRQCHISLSFPSIEGLRHQTHKVNAGRVDGVRFLSEAHPADSSGFFK